MFRRVGLGPIGSTIRLSKRLVGIDQSYVDAVLARVNAHGCLSEHARDDLWAKLINDEFPVPKAHLSLLLQAYRRSFLTSSPPAEKLAETFLSFPNEKKLVFHHAGFSRLIETIRFDQLEAHEAPEIFVEYAKAMRTANAEDPSKYPMLEVRV